MAVVRGQGTGPEADRELVRALGRAHLVGSVRVLLVAVVALSAAFAFLFQGAQHTGAPPSPHLIATTGPQGSPSVPRADLPATDSGAPAVHIDLTATGPSTSGRAFSYGFDLATLAPAALTTGPAAAAVQVAHSVPGAFVDVPIMGWGEGNPEISPGVYNFAGIARQLAFVQASGATPVITLCAAPDWMKGGSAGTTDWTQIDTAPLAEHYQDFANLSAAVAQAFPQVRYFVVWNELKGFWNAATHTMNIGGYTTMYNDTYEAIKAVRPTALVGGPYVSVHSTSGPAPTWAPTPSGPWGHLDAGQLWNVAYWLSNKVGADFVAVDGRSYTEDAGLTTDPVSSTAKYAAMDQWLETQTSLPIVWMETHVLPEATTYTLQQQAAIRVAALLELASSGASVGMQWDPEQTGTWDEGLWTPIYLPGGGTPTPLAQDLPGVLGVLAAPVTLAPNEPAGTVVATGADGTVTVSYSSTTASVTVSPA